MAQYTQGEDGRWYYLASDNQWYPVTESDYTAQDDTTQDDTAQAGSWYGDDPNEPYEDNHQPAESSVASHIGTSEPEKGKGERSRRDRKKHMKENIDNILRPMDNDSKKDISKKSKDESKRRKKK